MLLSVQQKYILKALRELKCLQRKQLCVLLQGHFGWPDFETAQRRLDAMILQMQNGIGELSADAEFVRIRNARPDTRRLEAVDVMLELSEGRSQDFHVKCQSPDILRFSLEGSSLRLFTVATLSDPLHGSGLARDSPGRVVWISDSGAAPDKLSLPPKHFFAARQPDGSHRFYGS